MFKTNKLNLGFCIFLFVCIVFVSISPYVLFPQINKHNRFYFFTQNEEAFLELWNVDTFEGGTKARSKFLEDCAISFEKQNRKQYIIVQNLTKEELVEMLKQDKIPDLLSFGRGVGQTISPYCDELVIEADFRNGIEKSGEHKGRRLSVPWCCGGYVFCGNLRPDGVVGVGVENNLPPPITQSKKVYEKQYDAYKGFLNNEFDCLLGTQRDYFRLYNKLTLGAIESCEFDYVETYTDLLQHIAVCSKNKKHEKIAKRFVSYILSQQIQTKLNTIGMFSVLKNLIYKNTNYEEFELAIHNINSFGNVFIDDEKLNDYKQKY